MKRKLGIVCLLLFAFCMPFVLGACGGGKTLDLSDYGLEWMQEYLDRLDNKIGSGNDHITWKPTKTAAEIDDFLSDIRNEVLQSGMQLYRCIHNIESGVFRLQKEDYVTLVLQESYFTLDLYFLHSDGNVYNVNFYYINAANRATSRIGKLSFYIRLCDLDIVEI